MAAEWLVQYVPTHQTDPKYPKGEAGKVRGYTKVYQNGVSFPTGNGCDDWADCLTCPINIDKEGCHYKEYNP